METKIKAVFFDLDETLLDRKESLRDFVVWQANGMLRNSVFDVEKFCKRFIELDANGTVWKDHVYSELIREFTIIDWSVTERLQSYELCFSGFCKAKPNSIQAIKRLHDKGFKLGLVSNGKSPFQERNFKALGTSHLFESVIVSQAVGLRKPQKEIFKLACAALAVSPQQSVFVGDNPSADIEGANHCGMYTIFIPGQISQPCEAANATCDNYSELLQIVENAI